MNLVRQGKMTEAMKVYWQMQPLIDLIYNQEGLPTHLAAHDTISGRWAEMAVFLRLKAAAQDRPLMQSRAVDSGYLRSRHYCRWTDDNSW
jgi:hypothetical protein